jgi:hypothetical protein
MKAADVTATLKMALDAAGLDSRCSFIISGRASPV